MIELKVGHCWAGRPEEETLSAEQLGVFLELPGLMGKTAPSPHCLSHPPLHPPALFFHLWFGLVHFQQI